MKRRNQCKLARIGLTLACLLTTATAIADDRQTASNLFDAGAEAYDAGQYLIAAEAFLTAYTLVKSPALQFSAAQAYRRQYLLDSTPDALRRAVRLYRDYLRDDTSGERREDAMKALADLVPLEARLRRKTSAAVAAPPPAPLPATTPPDKPPTGKTAPVPIPVPGSNPPAPPPVPDVLTDEPEEPEPEPPRKTRVLISAKPTAAEVSIDGGAFVHVPAVVEVKAGAHKVHTKAEGYFDDDFEVEALDKELVARHVVLRPKPGRLSVQASSGGGLYLDGQLRAVLPLEQPLDVEPGEHFVSITRSGRGSFSKTVTIERNKDTNIRADLAMTNQRIGAWSMFTVGLLGAAATGVLGVLTWNQNTVATNLETTRRGGTMTTGEIATYNDALQLRNVYSRATMITGGVSALVLVTSAGMFLFDNPATIPVPQKKTDSGTPSPRIDLTVGLLAAGVRVQF